MRSLIKASLCAILVLTVTALQPAMALAQSDAGSLTVRVMDASGAAVPGAIVTVRSNATAVTREGVSDADGRAGFPLLTSGVYDVRVNLSGFTPYHDSAVRISVAQAADLPVRLTVGGVTEAMGMACSTLG